MNKRIISVLLCITIVFTSFGATFASAKVSKDGFSLSQRYNDYVDNKTVTLVSTSKIVRILNGVRKALGIVTGTYFLQKTFDVSFDKTISEVCKYIAERSALDIESICTGLPDIQNGTRLLFDVLPVDISVIRDYLFDYKEQMLNENNYKGAAISHMLGAGLSVVEKAEVYAERIPDESDDVIAVKVDVTFKDGSKDLFEPPIYINLTTGDAYGRDGKGMLSVGFDFNIYTLVAYATINSWQRDFGFCIAYDIFCYLMPIFNYRTRRFKFEYDNKEWMIQIWKGAYIVANGCEVGVYNRDKGSLGTFYNCIEDEDMMYMSMTLTRGDETILSLPRHLNWWENAFKLSPVMYHPYSLTLNFTLDMPNEEMLKAFTKSIDNQIYHDVKYEVNGLTVSCCW